MVLSFVVLQISRSHRLVSETEFIQRLYSALPVTDERIARRRAVNIILTTGEIPHKVSPVHPVQLIIEEERKILEESRLLMLGTGHNLSAIAHILKIEAVVSGTLNFIFNKISADVPFSETIRMAKEQGYSEPDPRIDLSGKDVIRKLVILAREAGYVLEQEDVEKNLFVPDEFFQGSLDEFWKNIPSLDADFEERRQKLEAENKHWKFVAKLEDGKGSVSLQEVSRSHPFYGLEGSNNIVLLTTERYKEYPMMIQGYGAGASVTAAGVFADIISVANI